MQAKRAALTCCVMEGRAETAPRAAKKWDPGRLHHPTPGPAYYTGCDCRGAPGALTTQLPVTVLHLGCWPCAQVFKSNGFESTNATQYPPSQVRLLRVGSCAMGVCVRRQHQGEATVPAQPGEALCWGPLAGVRHSANGVR